MHFKVKDWKTGWTGELVIQRGGAIKRCTDAFTYLQAGEHNPEVMRIYSNGSDSLVHASQPSPAVALHASVRRIASAAPVNILYRIWITGFIFRLLETHSPTLFFSALLT